LLLTRSETWDKTSGDDGKKELRTRQYPKNGTTDARAIALIVELSFWVCGVRGMLLCIKYHRHPGISL